MFSPRSELKSSPNTLVAIRYLVAGDCRDCCSQLLLLLLLPIPRTALPLVPKLLSQRPCLVRPSKLLSTLSFNAVAAGCLRWLLLPALAAASQPFFSAVSSARLRLWLVTTPVVANRPASSVPLVLRRYMLLLPALSISSRCALCFPRLPPSTVAVAQLNLRAPTQLPWCSPVSDFKKTLVFGWAKEVLPWPTPLLPFFIPQG